MPGWGSLRARHVGLLLLRLLGRSCVGADEYCCPIHENHSDPEIWDAVRSMQPWMLLHQYQRGADIEARDEQGLTPMAYAARAGAFGMVRMFMDLNVSIDVVNNDGITPLMDVVQRGQLDMARMLLEEGANPDTRDPLGLTPVWYASKFCWTQMVRLLLDFNAETEARDNRNIGPLALAALANRRDVATLLLERGANPIALKEIIADPSLRRKVYWWDVSTLESLLADRGFYGMLGLLNASLVERRLTEEAQEAERAREEELRRNATCNESAADEDNSSQVFAAGLTTFTATSAYGPLLPMS